MKPFLEQLMTSIDNLPCVENTDLDKLPSVSGIYFVFDQDSIIYIGKSNNILNRWTSEKYGKHHILDKIMVDNFKVGWLALDRSKLAVSEILLIEYYQPLLNIQKPEVSNNKNTFNSYDIIDSYLMGYQKGLLEGIRIGRGNKNEEVMKVIKNSKTLKNIVNEPTEKIEPIEKIKLIEKIKIRDSISHDGTSDTKPHCPHCGNANLTVRKDKRYYCLNCKKITVPNKIIWK